MHIISLSPGTSLGGRREGGYTKGLSCRFHNGWAIHIAPLPEMNKTQLAW